MSDQTAFTSGTSAAAQDTPNQPTYQQVQASLRRDPAFHATMNKLYSHLRAVAANIRRPFRFATLGTTDLLHEATMKLLQAESLEWKNEVHLQRIAAAAMRQIMIDTARTRKARIHGGDLTRVPMDEWLDIAVTWDESMLDLDSALTDLGEKHSREAQSVDLHFFGGLTVSETAAALGVSESTIAGDLRFAFRFLSSRMKAPTGGTPKSQTGTEKQSAMGTSAAQHTRRSVEVPR